MTAYRTAQGTQYMQGRALPIALVVILLCGGLFYALTLSSERAADTERLQLVVSEVTHFPAAIHTAIARLQKDGVPLDDLDFDLEGSGSRAIFSSYGGQVVYKSPPAALGNGIDWKFKTVTPAQRGWFIAGAGSDAAEGKDVFAYLTGIPERLCEALNKAAGLPAAPRVELSPVNLAQPGDAAATAGLNAWTFYAHRTEPTDKTPPAACVRNGADGVFVYYHLLAAQ